MPSSTSHKLFAASTLSIVLHIMHFISNAIKVCRTYSSATSRVAQIRQLTIRLWIVCSVGDRCSRKKEVDEQSRTTLLHSPMTLIKGHYITNRQFSTWSNITSLQFFCLHNHLLSSGQLEITIQTP